MISKRVITLVAVWMLFLGMEMFPFSQVHSPKWQSHTRVEEDLFDGKFSLVCEPLLSQPTCLRFTVNPMVSFSSLEIKLFLSNDIIWNSGSLTWKGEAFQNVPISLDTEINISSVGVHRVRAFVIGQTPEGFVDRSYFLYISADDKNIEVSPLPPQIEHLQPFSLSGVIADLEQTPQRLAGVEDSFSAAMASVTLTGRWQYTDDSGVLRPIRGARVKIYDDGLVDLEIGSGHTDDSGYYSFSVSVTGNRNIYSMIENESDAAKVTNGNDFDIAYWGRTPTVVVSETNSSTWNFGTYFFSADDANWQAMDYVLDEYYWIDNQVDWTRSQIEVEWPTENWPHSHGDSIHLPDKAIADWDRTTILHEYAHCVMYAAYGNSWPPGGGGSHAVWSENIGQSNGTLVPGNGGFAIIEGWAEFMEAAVDNNAGNLAALSPQADLDGDGTWGSAHLAFINGSWNIVWDDRDDARMKNVEDNEWWMGENYRPDNSGNIVEGAVASILWDIFDERNDDGLYEGFDEIWAVVRDQTPDDLVEFRTSYVNNNPDHENGLCSIFDNHGIPCFNVLSPTEVAPGYAGPNNHPRKIIIQVVTDYGLGNSDFTVTIGSKRGTVVTTHEAKGIYSLEVVPPTQSTNGFYDLSVTAGTRADGEINAVHYADANSLDINLVIDRSGSMDTAKMNAAKDAAKQFVDLMQVGDMIGVVSFDDIVETNFPLTVIAQPSVLPPLFSDNMESGEGKWNADTPWGLTTASAQSPSHAWTDSPTGNYANGINISLRTLAPVNISSAITMPVVGFWQRYDLESGYDKGYVEVSTDGGSSWNQLGSYISGTNLTWHRVERDLTMYRGQDVLIRFRFQTDSSVTRDGWYIDDVIIGQSAGDTKSQARDSIDLLTSRGMTSIGGGLQRGQEQLSTRGNANHPWAIVLLSDGLENTSPYVANVLPAIVASKTVVHAIGLGTDADEALMLDVASQTGGTYNFAPTAQELSGIYHTISGAVANRQTLLAYSGTAQQGITDQVDVVVDSTVDDATFALSWSNSSSVVELTLRAPNGQIINPEVAAGNADIEHIAGSTYTYYRIKVPTLAAGVWTMRITGGAAVMASPKELSFSTLGEPYNVRVSGNSDLALRLYLDRTVYLTGQPIKLVATLSDDQPLPAAMVTVRVQHGSLAVGTANLYDDGQHGDGGAADGVYANTLGAVFTAGSYTFSARAEGESNYNGSFVRLAERSTYIAVDPNLRTDVYLPLVLRAHQTTSPNWFVAGLAGRVVYALAYDPTRCDVRYAGTGNGLFKSTDSGSTWVAQGMTGLTITSLAVHPNMPQTVYAATWGQGVHKSTDGGNSWTKVNSGLGSNLQAFPLAMSADGSTLYVSVLNEGVFKSTNGGALWTAVNVGLSTLEVRALAVAPHNSQLVFAGTTRGVYRSNNAAASWSLMSSVMGGTTVWQFAIVGDKVVAATNNGIYRSLDAGNNWSQVGAAGQTFYAVAPDPGNGQRFYAGSATNGVYRSTDGGEIWATFNAGLGNKSVQSLTLDGGVCHLLNAGTENGVWGYRD